MIELIEYRSIRMCHKSYKHRDICISDLKDAGTPPIIQTDTNVSIIISKSSIGSGYQLLRLRYHNLEIAVNRKLSLSLFNDILQNINHGGYECMHTGGSSGKTKLNKNFFNFFMHSNNNLPRYTQCTKIIQTKTKWICIYLSAKYKK